MLETTDEPPQQPMRLLAAVSVNVDLDELEAERSAGNERKGRVVVEEEVALCSFQKAIRHSSVSVAVGIRGKCRWRFPSNAESSGKKSLLLQTNESGLPIGKRIYHIYVSNQSPKQEI